jgi:hypothetical protein
MYSLKSSSYCSTWTKFNLVNKFSEHKCVTLEGLTLKAVFSRLHFAPLLTKFPQLITNRKTLH